MLPPGQPGSHPPSTATPDGRAAALAALRLQVEWGADEALDDLPLDRLGAPDRPDHAAAPSPSAAARNFPTGGPAARPSMPRMPARPVAGPPPLPAAADPAQAADLAALLAAWAAFDGCPLRRTAASTVLPSGDPSLPLLLIGEAPDDDDDRAGAAFSGSAGRYLDRMLASIGLAREAVRVAFLSPWRPPGGRQVSDSELRACLPFLHRYVALAPPRRLVLLGTLPLRALLGSAENVRRARGRWRDAALPGLDRAIPTMATHPPAQVAGNPLLRRDAWADLLLLRRTLDEDAATGTL